MNGSHAIMTAIKTTIENYEPKDNSQWYIDEYIIDCDAEEFWDVVEKVLEDEPLS